MFTGLGKLDDLLSIEVRRVGGKRGGGRMFHSLVHWKDGKVATSRQAAMVDPQTKKITYIDTCFDTHHLMFAEDADNTLWFNGYGSPYIGWLNTKMFDQTHDAMKSQGWTGLILDTNGNGKRDEGDKAIDDALYTVSPAPDGSVWGSVLGYPGAIVRLVPGPNPTETGTAHGEPRKVRKKDKGRKIREER